MIRQEFVEMLRCPENRTRLDLADEGLLKRLNDVVAQGTLKNKAGQVMDKPLEGGLVREDRTVLYPIVHDIPILLVDEGILLDQLPA